MIIYAVNLNFQPKAVYLKAKNTATAIELPLDKVSQIKDLRSGKMLKAEKVLSIDVPAGEIRLLYVKG